MNKKIEVGALALSASLLFGEAGAQGGTTDTVYLNCMFEQTGQFNGADIEPSTGTAFLILDVNLRQAFVGSRSSSLPYTLETSTETYFLKWAGNLGNDEQFSELEHRINRFTGSYHASHTIYKNGRHLGTLTDNGECEKVSGSDQAF